jgi:hypothetical protein
VPLHRITMTAPSVPAAVPAQQQADGQWSVFVAADLAPMFEESPWLNGPPSEEGQADLLARLDSIADAPFAAARALLQAAPRESAEAGAALIGPGTGTAVPAAARNFLLTVMNNESAPLALRIEAAKALLADRSG